MASRPRIGLALGSGAARGWAHIGVIEALEAEGIVPDIVCGTSMGALVGAVYVSGRMAELKDWALKADWRTVLTMIDVGLSGGGLVGGTRIVSWLDGLGLAKTLDALPRPFAAVATDLQAGREIWLRDGELGTAIRASIAMPGIFTPISRDGLWLVDGGLVNPVPVSVCRALGADFVIAVNLNDDLVGRRFTAPEEPLPATAGMSLNIMDLFRPANGADAKRRWFAGTPASPAYFDVLANALNIMQDHITRSRLAGEPPHALVLPRVSEIGVLDFHRAEPAIEEGRKAAALALPAIRARLGLAEKSG